MRRRQATQKQITAAVDNARAAEIPDYLDRVILALAAKIKRLESKGPVAPAPAGLGQRAVAYIRNSMAMRKSDSDQRQNWILGHLHTFAAQEVARARRESVDACDAVLVGLRNGGARNAAKAVRERIIHASLPLLDDALRERGLTHVGFVEKGGVVTDVNHKPVTRASRCVHCGFARALHYGEERRCGIVDDGKRHTPSKKGAR